MLPFMGLAPVDPLAPEKEKFSIPQPSRLIYKDSALSAETADSGNCIFTMKWMISIFVLLAIATFPLRVVATECATSTKSGAAAESAVATGSATATESAAAAGNATARDVFYGLNYGINENSCPSLEKYQHDFSAIKQYTNRVRTFALSVCNQGTVNFYFLQPIQTISWLDPFVS